MTDCPEVPASFNLWTEAWIALERPAGGRDRLNLEQALLRADEYVAICEPSPLIVVGIHRLLVAVLQHALDPRRWGDLEKLWAQGRFPPEAVAAFGRRYAHRLDLFSAEAPFLQSGDLPLRPGKRDRVKTVAYLTPEVPAATEITHFRHGRDAEQVYCPACAAGGLVSIPAFATAGGSGIKPSINGVPPLYVLPGGRTLFESLAASLLLPQYQPEVAWRDADAAWWARDPVVERGREVLKVGYLHSLTFPARRVRLHPERPQEPCTRCGERSEWGVRTMIFDMGESRPKDAPFWFDPFAAYRLPSSKSSAGPTAIRPKRGQPAWREFASLFLQCASAHEQPTRRPAVVDQIADLQLGADLLIYPFRCVGMRTDRRAKVFEWVDAGFGVPTPLLSDAGGALVVAQAIRFADDCARIIAATFDRALGGSRRASRYRGLRERMRSEYWVALSDVFRSFVLTLGASSPDGREAELARWLDVVVGHARAAFRQACAAAGDQAVALRGRVQGEFQCDARLARKRKEYLPHE